MDILSEEFEEWFTKEWKSEAWASVGGTHELVARRFAGRAFERARKDHYRIGEKVIVNNSSEPSTGIIDVHFHVNEPGTRAEDVCRIPEWEPEEGEPVFIFTGHESRVHVGRFDGFESDGRGKIVTQSGECARTNMHCIKPFSSDKIGKPWNEI